MLTANPQVFPCDLHPGSQNIAFGADFSGALLLETPGGDVITYDAITSAGATITPIGVTLSALSIVDGKGGAATAVIFTVSGGVGGAVYEITFTITGASGQIPLLPVLLRCQ